MTRWQRAKMVAGCWSFVALVTLAVGSLAGWSLLYGGVLLAASVGLLAWARVTR